MPLFKRAAKDAPRNRLEETLLLAMRDPSARSAFYRELLESEVFVVGETKGDFEDLGAGYRRAGPGTHLSVTMLDGGQGRRLVGFFSSLARLQESFKPRAQANFVRINARILFEALPGETFVLNPRSSVGKEFPPDEVRALLNGSIFQPQGVRLAAGQSFYIGDPKERPQALLDALSQYFRKTGIVEKAYLAQIHVPDSGQPPHVIVGIVFCGGVPKDVPGSLPDLGAVVAGSIEKDQVVDFTVVTSDQISQYLVNQTSPFFTK